MARRLTLYDFRDLDLMMKLEETGGASGATTAEFAEALGMGDEVLAVRGRSSWMRRYGMIDYNEETRLWTLSDGGERVVSAKLRAAAAKTVDTVPDESMIDVMAHVTSRYRQGDEMMATMLRREFAFGTNPRSRVWNGR
jgi:hypothetical protein